MNPQNLQSNTTDEELAPSESGLPEKSASSDDRLPNISDGETNQEDTWDSYNSKLSGAEPDTNQNSEVDELRRQLAEARKEREMEEKRRKDAQRAFKERSEELKRLRESQENAHDDDGNSSNQASANSAPENESEEESEEERLDREITEYGKSIGWTEEVIETYRLNPELYIGLTQALDHSLDSGLSKREREQEEARAKKLEEEIAKEEHETFMKGVSSFHKDAQELVDSQEFNIWLRANEPLRAMVMHNTEYLDPSGLVQLLDKYKQQKKEVDDLRQQREYYRQSSVSEVPMRGAKSSSEDNESWDKLNAMIEKQRSR